MRSAVAIRSWDVAAHGSRSYLWGSRVRPPRKLGRPRARPLFRRQQPRLHAPARPRRSAVSRAASARARARQLAAPASRAGSGGHRRRRRLPPYPYPPPRIRRTYPPPYYYPWPPPGCYYEAPADPRPLTLPYEEGRAAPPGYHVESRVRRGPVFAGSLMFGSPMACRCSWSPPSTSKSLRVAAGPRARQLGLHGRRRAIAAVTTTAARFSHCTG